MKNLESLKTKSQASMAHLVDLGKQQPPQVKVWGITAASAVVGGLALSTVAQSVLAIVGVLAATPVSLTVGAVGGGVLGWRYLQRRSQPTTSDQSSAAIPADPALTLSPATASSSNGSLVEERAPVAQTTLAPDPVQTSEAVQIADAPQEVAQVESAAQDAVQLEKVPPDAVQLEDIPALAASVHETVETVAPTATLLPPAELSPAELSPAELLPTGLPLVEVSEHLEAIKGIGAGYAKRLREAGIHTFTDLAKQIPEQLRTLIHIDRHVTDAELLSWIEQARTLAAQTGEKP